MANLFWIVPKCCHLFKKNEASTITVSKTIFWGLFGELEGCDFLKTISKHSTYLKKFRIFLYLF